MSWKKYLNDGRVKRHRTSKRELSDLRAVIERDLRDSSVSGLSLDSKFTLAYNAALMICKMAIACAGYRVTSGGHHRTMFEVVDFALGANATMYASYFNVCRRKRNKLVYDVAKVTSRSEAREMREKAIEFRDIVEKWIKENYPEFS
jgi:hypothetical protein